MFKLDKGIRPPTRETYTQHFEELKSKGFILDYYNDNTTLEELSRIEKHSKELLVSALFKPQIDNNRDSKDLRSK